MPLKISVFSDVICPWCYLGKRRLEHALDHLGLRETTVIEWLPFELNPNMPVDGMERLAYRARKFGAERSGDLDAQMTELGREVGIAFAFEQMQRTPNTQMAHMLIAVAQRQGKADMLVEELFRAYFENGRDVGDENVLVGLAAAAGLDRDSVTQALKSDELRNLVESVEAQAQEMQIAGVPFFTINRESAVSGAQTTEQWVALLLERQNARRNC